MDYGSFLHFLVLNVSHSAFVMKGNEVNLFLEQKSRKADSPKSQYSILEVVLRGFVDLVTLTKQLKSSQRNSQFKCCYMLLSREVYQAAFLILI
jgi:hypothetical protein